ncbi:MAG: methyltransferase [Planctomycetota bacterium]
MTAADFPRSLPRPNDPPHLAKLRGDLTIESHLHRERAFTFASTWGLFSPRAIDAGTDLLLKHFRAEPHHDSLDLGCGYGPIACALANDAPHGSVLALDRDYLAVDYTRRNAAVNQLPNLTADLGHGLSTLPPDRKFHNIVSNLPAKVGSELLQVMLHDAHAALHPGGRLCVVTITGLRQFVKRHCQAVFGHYDKLKQTPAYTVAMAVKD